MAKRELPMSSFMNLGSAAAAAPAKAAFQRDARLAAHGEMALAGGPAVDIEEETLVVDARSALSPAQMVESKLSRKLQETSLPVSHLQMRVLLRTR